ncbi:MAG: DoxX family protein [Cytophagales bacterium]|nr:DoxX family protein [Cytophagales bacterium]
MHRLTLWFTQNAIHLLRISIGIIYVWFGALKFFPNLSPADQLARTTINLITFGLIPDNVSIILLAIWETLLGLVLIAGLWRTFAFYVLLVHMVCTFVPLFFFTEVSFTNTPYAFTLVGQYIMKNLIIIWSALLIHAHHKGTVIVRTLE